MSDVRTPTKVYFTEAERDLLDEAADRHQISRGQLIREFALKVATRPAKPAPAPIPLRAVPAAPGAPSLALYTAAVDRAARVAGGIPRPHLEAVVAAVLNTLMEPRSADQSSATSERIAS